MNFPRRETYLIANMRFHQGYLHRHLKTLVDVQYGHRFIQILGLPLILYYETAITPRYAMLYCARVYYAISGVNPYQSKKG